MLHDIQISSKNSGSCKAYLFNQEILQFHGARNLISVLSRILQGILRWPNRIYFTPWCPFVFYPLINKQGFFFLLGNRIKISTFPFVLYISQFSFPSLNNNENNFVPLLRSCQIIRPCRRICNFVLCLIYFESLKHREACPIRTVLESFVPSWFSAISFRRIRKAVWAKPILVFCNIILLCDCWLCHVCPCRITRLPLDGFL